MRPAEPQADAPAATRPPRRERGGLFWAMLAAIGVLAVVAAIAIWQWTRVLGHADEQAARATSLQAAADQATGLRQRVAALQEDLAEAREHGQALQAQLVGGKTLLDDAQNRANAAEDRATVAEKAVSDAERARADLQARLDTARPPGAQPAERSPSPQPAGNIVPAPGQPDIAPELPLPGLPGDATPRDYLVAAQQAVREGRNGLAQAALERAETRMLNRASLARDPAQPASHPGVTEIERALDQLAAGNTQGTLQAIDSLLARH